MLVVAGFLAVTIIVADRRSGSFTSGVSVLNDLYGMTAIVVGAAVTVFLLSGFTQRVNVRLVPAPRWEDNGLLVIGMQIENPARLRALRPRARVLVCQYALKADDRLPDWVPFEKKYYEKNPEPPLLGGWQRPIAVFASTDLIYPGETVSVEHLARCHEEATVIHVGLQVTFPRWRNLGSHTATCFVLEPKLSHGSDPGSLDRP